MFGRIKTVKREKGFAFISPNGGGADVFAHVTSLVGLNWSDDLVGLRVEYQVEATDKGPRAINIRAAE